MQVHDWDTLGKRLDQIEAVIKDPPRTRWQKYGVPSLMAIASIIIAAITALITNEIQTRASGRAKAGETRGEGITKGELELYTHVALLRQQVRVGLERFLKRKGKYDADAEEASVKLTTILETRPDLPAEVKDTLRALNNYANLKKVELLKVPKKDWPARETGVFDEARKLDEAAYQAIDGWYRRLKPE